MTLLSLLLISIGIQIIIFIPAFIFKTDKLTDISYGLGFVLLNLVALILSGFSWMKFFVFLMILIWAIRLGTYLFVRILKIKKDSRFDGIRENLVKFLGFWFLQGISIWIISLAALVCFLGNPVFSYLSLIGLVIWFSGLLIETTADLQKFRFMNNPNNSGKWIESGIWKYSRHPNYFGEILVWLGLFIFVLPMISGWQILIALASPVFIAFLLIFVSGLPKLEKMADSRWGGDLNYQNYKKQTSILVLWPRKKLIK